MKCKECNQNFKMLTKEELCAFCYQKKFGKWSDNFTENNNKKKGK